MNVELLLIGIIGVTIGIITCFFGWQVFKLVLVLWGFLFGAMIGVALATASSADLSTGFILVIGAGSGIVGGALALVLYVIGIFLAGAAFGFGLAVSIITSLIAEPSTLLVLFVAVLSALVFGILATRLNKGFVVLITAISGAVSLTLGTLILFDPSSFSLTDEALRFNSVLTPVHYIIVLVLAVFGAFFQFSRSRGDKTG